MQRSLLEELLKQIIEIAWDSIGIRKSISGINIKNLLVNQLSTAIANELSSSLKQENIATAKKFSSELYHMVLDLVKLWKLATRMSERERKILPITLLSAFTLALLNRNFIEKCRGNRYLPSHRRKGNGTSKHFL